MHDVQILLNATTLGFSLLMTRLLDVREADRDNSLYSSLTTLYMYSLELSVDLMNSMKYLPPRHPKLLQISYNCLLYRRGNGLSCVLSHYV